MTKETHFWNGNYDSTERLVCCQFEHLNRKIGVYASRSMHHAGMGGNAVEVCFESIEVNTVSAGTWYPETEWKEVVIKDTEYVIGQLDKVITELQGHRDRLQQELGRLNSIWGNSPDGATP
jgi:hypothetical protein